MGFPAPPLKPTTPEEASIIVWLAIIASVVGGVVAFYFAAQAGTPEDAAWLRKVGFISVGIAGLILVARKIVALLWD